jgi:hypothetical protein
MEKMIFHREAQFLKKNGINLGKLSGIVAHFVPKYLQKNRMPSWKTNCIEDWETKVNAIVEETFQGIWIWLLFPFLGANVF